jgi:putative membrane protein
MDKETSKVFNKDLILREKLAIERTSMSNDTTFLAFLRTALYFSIAGMSVNRLLHLDYGLVIETVFWIIAVYILIVGIIKYRRQKRNLRESVKHIGDYKLNWEQEIDLE